LGIVVTQPWLVLAQFEFPGAFPDIAGSERLGQTQAEHNRSDSKQPCNIDMDHPTGFTPLVSLASDWFDPHILIAALTNLPALNRSGLRTHKQHVLPK
jgi:hypothetical protein